MREPLDCPDGLIKVSLYHHGMIVVTYERQRYELHKREQAFRYAGESRDLRWVEIDRQEI